MPATVICAVTAVGQRDVVEGIRGEACQQVARARSGELMAPSASVRLMMCTRIPHVSAQSRIQASAASAPPDVTDTK